MTNNRKEPKTRYEKILCRRGHILEILAFLLALASMVLGMSTLSGSGVVETWFFNLALVLYKIFSYLDTCSDWQFSLFTYEEAKEVKVGSVPNSCVYTRQSGVVR